MKTFSSGTKDTHAKKPRFKGKNANPDAIPAIDT